MTNPGLSLLGLSIGGIAHVALVLVLVGLAVALYSLGRVPRPAARRAPPSTARLVRRTTHVAALLVFLGLFGGLVVIGGNLAPQGGPASGIIELVPPCRRAQPDCGVTNQGGLAVVVEVVLSPEVRPWLEPAAARFMRECPNIQLRLATRDDLDAAHAILRGELRPTVWIPADVSLRYLEFRWRERASDVLMRPGEELLLAFSPLVLLTQPERARSLSALRDATSSIDGLWPEILCAHAPRTIGRAGADAPSRGEWTDWAARRWPPPLVVPESPEAAALAAWGRVRFEHPSPTRSVGGLAALYLLAQAFAAPGSVDAEAVAEAVDVRREALAEWLARCEADLAPLDSAEALTDAFVNFGSRRYDGVVTYEHLALATLRRLDPGSLEAVQLVYPAPTLVTRYSAALLWPDDDAQAIPHYAARRWLDALRGEEAQREAVQLGLRPTAPDLSLRSVAVEGNPFMAFRRCGVELELELNEPPQPSGRVVLELLELWQDATGRP